MPNIDSPLMMKQKRIALEMGKACEDFANGKTRGDQRPYAWAILVWPMGKPDEGAAYLCNTQREEAIKLMRAQVEQFERKK